LEWQHKSGMVPAVGNLRVSREMQFFFHTLDVFTDTRFGGNPLAVVLDADPLDSGRMQTIAREFNLSETVFVLKPHNPMHSARVRIFTPNSELPFAGHPTVGTAVLLADLRDPGMGGNRDAIIALEQLVGTVRVGVRVRPGQAAFAEFDAPRLPEDLGSVPAIDDIAAAIGLIPSEIGFENHKPTRFTAGLPYMFIPVRGLETVARARGVLGRWSRAFPDGGAAYVYCRETRHAAHAFHARMFDPDHGVPEDPATGSAAAAFAAVIQRFDDPAAGDHRYIIEQGFEMHRPSLIHLALEIEAGKLGTVRIGGNAVRVSSGTIEV
jgi:trans-2,3-dihydro-3-hydroxyanthranilate isomerase